jgi:hypothetical protein
LSLFLLGFLRCVTGVSPLWGLVAGAGLSFAALCRPMTAAGVALPFGLYLAWWSLVGSRTESSPDRTRRLRVALALAVPLVAGGAFLFVYDRAITGSGWTTPYSLYTDLHTPRHVYGFYNVTRGVEKLGPRVFEKYDRWADDLTPALALDNLERRVTASWKWTLGLIPLTLALVAGLVWLPTLGWPARLILAGIISLHAVHVPYWFVGMQDYHYVFESGPLWALWTAAVTVQAFRGWHTEGRSWMSMWWLGLLASAVVMNYAVRGGLWSAPLNKGLVEVRFARVQHGRFRELVARDVHPLPALVLIEDDPADRHIDFVVNDPALDGPVLFAHYLPELADAGELRRLFPGRSLFLYHAREKRLEPFAGD